MKRFIPLLLFTVLPGIVAIAQIPKGGLSLWLKADKGVQAVQDKLVTWQDQSGKNHHAKCLSTNAPILVSSQINGLPVVRFNGVDNSIETVPFQAFPNKRGTISIVVRTNGSSETSGGGYGTLVSTYFNEGVTWQFGVSKELAIYYDGVGTEGFPVATIPEKKWSIVTISRNTDTSISFYREGSFRLSFRIKNNQPDINPFKIASNGRLEVLNGDIAEIIVYNKALSEAELKNVHSYLQGKYNLKPAVAREGMSNWWLFLMLLIPVLYLAVLITKHFSQKKLKRELARQEEMNMERQRISREMHDDIGAGLTQITMMSEWAKNRPGTGNVKELDDIAETSRKLVSSMSEIIWSLNPDNRTFNQLIAYLREILNSQLEYSGKEYSLQLPELSKDILLSNEQRRNILLVTKEIVNNAIKHSGATKIAVKLEIVDRILSCEITDNGNGFDPAMSSTGNGLKNLEHRINVLGGRLQIDTGPGKGSRFFYRAKL